MLCSLYRDKCVVIGLRFLKLFPEVAVRGLGVFFVPPPLIVTNGDDLVLVRLLVVARGARRLLLLLVLARVGRREYKVAACVIRNLNKMMVTK